MAVITGSNESDFGTSGLGDLVGTADADTISGLNGNDVIVSLGGVDTLQGGAGNDSVFGGDGDDVAFLGRGDDLFGWNPGEDNDLIEGGQGNDTMLFNGANVAEQIDMSAVGERFRFFRDIANVVMDTNQLEQVDFNALGGVDTITINDLTTTDIKQINLNLAAAGSTGGDGQTDTVIVNGSGNADTVNVNGAAGKANISGLTANVQITGGETSLDRLTINPLLGADKITLNNLPAAGLQAISLNLAAADSTSSDGAVDLVTLNASKQNDVITISGALGSVVVSGLGAEVTIAGADATQDLLAVNGLDGNDTIDATNLTPGALRLQLDGGKGNDLLIGGGDVDTLNGGSGNDFADGRRGNDIAFLGAGNDAFLWNPGEGNDRIEGGAGQDTMIFNGSGANEKIDMVANGERFTFLRDVAAVVMDTNTLEQVDFQALGGTDTININNLTGTDIKQINLNLGLLGTVGGDGQIDTINTDGTSGGDNIRVASSGIDVVVSGLAANVAIARADAALDQLVVSGGRGADQIKATGLNPNSILLTLDGKAGDDSLLGSADDDTLVGGAGKDTLIGGNGADSLTGGAGRDSFRYNSPVQGGDTITDFSVTDDQIVVRAAGFGGGLTAGSPISSAQFALGAAVDAGDRFIYNTTSGELFFDRDGTGAQAQVLLATLTGAPAITNADIVVV